MVRRSRIKLLFLLVEGYLLPLILLMSLVKTNHVIPSDLL